VNKLDVNNKVLNWIAKSYDTVSFEDHKTGELVEKFKLLFRWMVKTRIAPFRCYVGIAILLKLMNKIRRVFAACKK
jgi:hypothetical protein